MKKNRKPSLCHCINLRRVSKNITNIYDDFLKPTTLNVTQYSLLANLKRVEPIKMSDFSKVARLDRTTLVRNLKPLISSGLIELNDISKSNAKLLILSQKGTELTTLAQNYWEDAQNFIEENIGLQNLNQFYEIVEKIENLSTKEEQKNDKRAK